MPDSMEKYLDSHKAVTFYLPNDTYSRVKRLATSQGLKPSSLARMLLCQKLHLVDNNL